MRVRIANATVRRADGIKDLFEFAVQRHLAWIVGSGHVYKDLDDVADAHDYTFWTPEVGEETPDAWFAVRNDFVKEGSSVVDNDSISFEGARDGIGVITLSTSEESEFDDRESHFTLLSTGKPVETDGFSYTEILYSVAANKS